MEDLGATTVSSGAGDAAASSAGTSAPPPDTAATSAPPAATDSTPAAASAATDAAASTETGATTAAPASLDDLWKEFSTRKPEEAAPETSAEAKEAEAKPEEKPAGEARPDAVQADEAEAEEAKAEPDPLAEEQSIPTRDEINEQHKRAPKAIRDLAADLAERAQAAEGKITKIGGDEGLQVAEAIIPHLFGPKATEDSVNAVFEALVETNAPLVASMGQSFINHALDDEKTGPAFADRLLQGEFGEGYTAERLRVLVALDREGLIDVDGLREDLGTAREPTARERELEGKLKETEARVKELTGGQEDATRREEQRLRDTVTETVSRAVMAKVLPVAEQIGWVEKEGDNKGPHAGLLGRLGKLAISDMNAEIKKSPEWDAVQQLVEEGRAFQNGQPTRAMRVNLEAIERRGTAMFKKTAREFRPLISLLAAQGAQAKEDPPPPQTGRSEGGDAAQTDAEHAARKTPESLDEIHEQFARKQRDAAAPVGTLRR